MRKDVLKFSLISHLPNLFDPKYRIDSTKTPRCRLFTTKSFFLTMVHLVMGGHTTGYLSALMHSFSVDHDRTPPSAAAFCKLRKVVSYKFFKTAFERLVDLSEQKKVTWKNLRVVAIDGMNLILPRTKDIIKHNFTGRKTSRYEESYMPRGYMTMAFDVLTGIIMGQCLNATLNELADALA